MFHKSWKQSPLIEGLGSFSFKDGGHPSGVCLLSELFYLGKILEMEEFKNFFNAETSIPIATLPPPNALGRLRGSLAGPSRCFQPPAR